MSVEIKLPDLGEGIESGDILEILVAEGETIAKDQNIVEIETDKATVEVPSSHAGTVMKVHVQSGDSVNIGQTLITVETTAAETSATASPAPATEQPAAEVPPVAVPNPAPTPAVAAPPPATPAAAAPAPPAAPTPALVAAAPPQVGHDRPIPAGPAIRRFAREVGVDLATVTGSGENGRITREDVLQVVRRANQSVPEPAAPPSAAPEISTLEPETTTLLGVPGSDAWGPVGFEKTSKIRRTIAAKMHESWSTVPRVTNFDDADVTELEAIRQASKADYAAKGIRLTAMPFIIKAVSMALRENPTINSALDLENERVIYKHYINVGVAVDTERGLVVPALRNTDQKSISEIAKDVASMADRVRSGKFSLEDLRGGTFTISNLGAIGGTYSTPIVNVPEVAILLVGRSRKLPVVMDDEIEARLMMPLSLSYDHRIVDGATAARFLNDVIGFLEAPGRLLLAP